jgi:Flp pilus assembly protein TadG
MSRLTVWHDETGAVFVEFAIMIPVVVMIVCGSIDFLYAFYQLNAAAKAVELGARIASVSDPVAAGLNNLPNAAVLNGAVPEGPLPPFTVTCGDERCSCSGTCTGMTDNPFDSAAMNRIVYGRNATSCGNFAADHTIGMCNLLPSITPADVVIVYTQTALGYAGRPGGPVPTITVSLQNMRFQFFFLTPLLGVHIAMPPVTASVTAQDLCSAGGNGACGS